MYVQDNEDRRLTVPPVANVSPGGFISTLYEGEPPRKKRPLGFSPSKRKKRK